MIVACAISVADLGQITPDVLVLPERTTMAELQAAQRLSSTPIVVGAIEEGRYVRGLLLHHGRNHIDGYWKTLDDDRSLGSNRPPSRTPVYQRDGLAIGVLICRDCQDNHQLRADVLGYLQNSTAEVKLLCIPADMHQEWFQSERTSFRDVFLAVSNNSKPNNVNRCRSLIADPQGIRITTQVNLEAIHATVP
jgi:hypothetical protein